MPVRCVRRSSDYRRAGRARPRRRHLPARRLHPDQGAAARGRGRRQRPRRRRGSVSGPASTASTWPAVNAYKDGVVSRLFKGLTGLVKSRGITVIEGEGRMSGPRTVTVDGTHLHRRAPRPRPPAPTRARCPGSTSTASGCSPPSTHSPGPRARLGRGPRRWRDRVRVRQRLAHLRRRGHHRRGPSPAGPRRGRGLLQGPGADLPQARDRVPHRHPLRVGAGDRRRRGRLRRGRRRPRGRAAAGGGRPRPAHRRAGLRRAGRRAWTAASSSPTTACAPTCRGVFAVGDLVPGPQLAHRGFQHGIFVAEEIAGLDAAADRRDRRSRG